MRQLHNETVSVAEAGHAGGSVTYAKYGREYFRAIGRKGQASLAAKVTLEQRRIWGSMGGRPRKYRCPVVGEKEKH
jgi:hypothetical protein